MKTLWEKHKKSLWYLVLIVMVASVPLMTDYVFAGGSLAAALSRIRAVSRGFGQAFPVRIGTLGSMDYGYTAASFQADVFYGIPALLYLFGMELGSAYKWSLFLCNLAAALIAYASLHRCFGRREVSLMGSMLYTWNPYRLSEMYLTGDLGEIVAWSFLPMIFAGMWLLYAEERKEKSCGGPWVLLTWGFSLMLLSHTVVFFVTALAAILFLVLMGRETLAKGTLLEIGKTAAATVLVNAWFLIPMLLRMRSVEAVAPLLLQDVQSMGMQLLQYFTVFSFGGDNVLLFENGMCSAQAMGFGTGAVLLLFLGLFLLFTGRIQRCQENSPKGGSQLRIWKKMLWLGGILMLMSTNCFPWDLLQNRNMLFSVLLAFMGTPAKIGIAAGGVLLFAACMLLSRSSLSEAVALEKAVSEDAFSGDIPVQRGKREYGLICAAVCAVSFGTTQFLLGQILIGRSFLRKEEIATLTEGLVLPLITQESAVWRLCEGVSLAALACCAILWIVRRRKSC